jgi:CubicO group peptidase (beta-lactamase class C family)
VANYTVTLITDLAAFDDTVNAFMAKYAVPAVSIAVTHDDKLIYLKSYGQADREAGQAATNQNLYRLASVSKPITSVAIMRLVEQGKLHLSDTVFGTSGILGAAYGTLPYGPHITEITVDQLLHHIAGGWANDTNDPMFTNPAMTAAQLISWTLDHRPLQNAPGTAYAYSNFGYCVLGRVIEKVTGQGYEAAVKALVLAPIGVSDMTIAGNTLADRLPHEVRYYGQFGEDPYAFNIHRMDSHGGWVSTAKDLAAFLVKVDGYPDKADILQAATLATMTTPSTANANYACGWAVNTANNWSHIGSLPGTETEIIRTSTGWNFVMLVNTRSLYTTFDSDLDNVFWKSFAQLDAYPNYDLF